VPFLESLNSAGAEFLIVGSYTLAYHGSPGYTGGIDILVRPSAESAKRLIGAITAFGFGSLGITPDDFCEPYQVVQLGRPPNRIDLITAISGVTFDDAWSTRESGLLDGVAVGFIGRDAVVRNKRASGRLKDLADLEALGEQ